MIAVVDYGLGNVHSILNMLHRIGESAFAATEPEMIADADQLILPGVGSFDHGMTQLSKKGFADAIRYHTVDQGKLLLGICLGMQMLGNSSEEGKMAGLSLLDFSTCRFRIPANSPLKVPHMGWDIVWAEQTNPLINTNEKQQRFYFVHSYHAVCDQPELVLLYCDYGYMFPAAVGKDNIIGVQFHPEKSHAFGMNLFSNLMRSF